MYIYEETNHKLTLKTFENAHYKVSILRLSLPFTMKKYPPPYLYLRYGYGKQPLHLLHTVTNIYISLVNSET